MKLPLIMLLLTTIALAYPAPQGVVNDFAEVLTAQEEQQIAAITQEINAEIAIVTIPTLEDTTIELYAVELFEEWGIGKKGQDNGLLILIAPQDKKYRIEVGYGLEGELPDAKTGRIARDNFVSAFQQEKYAEGINNALQEIKATLNGEIVEQEIVPLNNVANSILNIMFLALLASLFLGKAMGEKRQKIQGGIAIVLFLIIASFLSIIAAIIVAVIYLVLGALFATPFSAGVYPGYGFGGYRPGGFGGGFGGFGGGMSGGGGASGGW